MGPFCKDVSVADMGVDLTGILRGTHGGTYCKSHAVEAKKPFSYIVMQVIWCLKFCNMTKSGGGQSPAPIPRPPMIYAHGCRLTFYSPGAATGCSSVIIELRHGGLRDFPEISPGRCPSLERYVSTINSCLESHLLTADWLRLTNKQRNKGTG